MALDLQSDRPLLCNPFLLGDLCHNLQRVKEDHEISKDLWILLLRNECENEIQRYSSSRLQGFKDEDMETDSIITLMEVY